MSKGQSKSAGSRSRMTPAKASSLQGYAATHPGSATAQTGFVRRAQRAADQGGAKQR